jgi:hypothetical protein
MQRQQMEQQQRQYEQQLAIQQAQYAEQKAIATAPPPPAPNPVAQAPTPALENAAASAPGAIRMGYGRKKMRTDIAGGGGSALSIPGA